MKNADSAKLLVLVFIFSAVSLVFSAVGFFVGSGSGPVDAEKTGRVVAELLDKKLYPQAIGTYERAMAVGRLSSREEARLHYLAGDLYLTYIGDYETALAHLLASRALEEHPDYEKERLEKTFFALERSGRSDIARKEKSDTSVTRPTAYSGVVVAVVGNRSITLAELKKEFAGSPPEVQATYVGLEGMKRFLEQYVSVELIYQSALRRGFDKEPNFPEVMERAKKEVLVQRVLDEEIGRGITVTPAEVDRFYSENKIMFGGKPFDQVAQQAAFLLRQKKEQEGYKQLVSRLGKTEKVQIFDDRVK